MAGDTAAFEDLMRRHNRRVSRATRAILRNDEEAEDAMQEAYVSAFAHRRDLGGRSRFSTWLVRIAVYEALGRLRRGKRLTSLDDAELEDREEPMATTRSPEGHASDVQLRVVLENAIDALPEGDKAPRGVDLDKGALPLDPPATAKFRKTQFKTAAGVAGFVVKNMPPMAPGSLKESDYWAILRSISTRTASICPSPSMAATPRRSRSRCSPDERICSQTRERNPPTRLYEVPRLMWRGEGAFMRSRVVLRRAASAAPMLVAAFVGTIAIVHCGSDDNATPRQGDSGATCTTPAPSAGDARANDVVDATTATVDPVAAYAAGIIAEGRKTFRYDTFGDEDFWGGALRLHDGIQGAPHGGAGPGVSPKAALAAGLKVDIEALPASLVDDLKKGKVDLDSTDTTLALLRANAVVGVTGVFDSSKKLVSMGIQCSLCHSTVDDSLVPGIGKRLDGWANRDLNVGAIVNLSPDLTPVATLLGVPEATVRSVLAGWGPGHFNAQLFLDRKAVGADGLSASAAALIPPAFGLSGVNMATYTGFGSSTYWNAFVANLEMHGKGTFVDSRLSDATQFPVSAGAGFSNVRSSPDLITAKLPALQFYQLAIPAPTPPAGSFDALAAARGKVAFEGAAKCSSCHVAPLFTEPGWNMHTGAEIGIDDFQSSRSPEKRYRTTPLKGLFSHTKGGFYHDGRFPTLDAVIEHYDVALSLGLTTGQKTDVAEYLKSL